jgi:hypothetical protein
MLSHGLTPNTTHANTPQTDAKKKSLVIVNVVARSTQQTHAKNMKRVYAPSSCAASLYHHCPASPPSPTRPHRLDLTRHTPQTHAKNEESLVVVNVVARYHAKHNTRKNGTNERTK